MRAKEFLLEYNRDITARQSGDQLLMALKGDQGTLLNDVLDSISYKLSTEVKTIADLQKYPQETRNEWKEQILAAIEHLDPTTTNKYVPWLARMYAKAGGGLRMEDINRMNLIGLYDLAKLRRRLKPEHKDINSFKWYVDFEDTMESEYGYFTDLAQGENFEDKADADKVFENDEVLIIMPKNEAAACKYGRQTRWCTAATQGYNYFDSYNRQGPLYILIPKNPEHGGEKYQLHFETNSYMDEDDYRVSLLKLLTVRFGNDVLEFFKSIRPELQNTILFMPKETLDPIMAAIKQRAEEYFWDITSEWEWQDDGYYQYLRDKGYVDEEGDIDWEAVPDEDSYIEYNQDLYYLTKDFDNAIDIHDVLEYIGEQDAEEYDIESIGVKNLASLVGDMLVNNARKIVRYEGEWVIQQVGKKLQKLDVLPNEKGEWTLK